MCFDEECQSEFRNQVAKQDTAKSRLILPKL